MRPVLSKKQIQAFVQNGFVRVDQAFPRELTDEGRAILWADTGFSPHNTATWQQPVIRLGNYGQAPFRQAANSPKLLLVYDQLVGAGR
jgi:hypothetical protein